MDLTLLLETYSVEIENIFLSDKFGLSLREGIKENLRELSKELLKV